jgi:hypothetical protein
MKKNYFSLAVAVALLAATACSSPPELEDGYQFGDISHLAVREQKEIKQAVADYCDKTKDSLIRYAALNIIRLKFPFVPENGICGKPP